MEKQSHEAVSCVEDGEIIEDERPTPSDRGNMILLFFLYVIHGIPYGLKITVPLILASGNATYAEQAMFSLASWSFSAKLVWAPIVDSVYARRFGRRKSWLIPSQYGMGLTMFYISYFIDDWLTNPSKKVDAFQLTIAFTVLNYLAATQDICVDGWAVTLLDKKNIGYYSVLEGAGHITGIFLGFPLLVALESKDFCNSYLRSVPKETGLLVISDFFFYCSFVLIILPTILALFKPEKDMIEEGARLSIKESYVNLWKICQLPPMKWLSLILLTVSLWSAPVRIMFDLKLVENGVARYHIGVISAPRILFDLFFMISVSKWTSGPRPLRMFKYVFLCLVCFSYVAISFIWTTPLLLKDAIINYYVLLFGMLTILDNLQNTQRIVLVTFYAKICDPAVGGTYMTLLHTISNLGHLLSNSLSLWLAGFLSAKQCDFTHSQNATVVDSHGLCHSSQTSLICTENGGVCRTTFDGFYLETIVFASLGFIWIYMLNSKLKMLESLKEISWRMPAKYFPVLSKSPA